MAIPVFGRPLPAPPVRLVILREIVEIVYNKRTIPYLKSAVPIWEAQDVQHSSNSRRFSHRLMAKRVTPSFSANCLWLKLHRRRINDHPFM